MSAPRRVPPRSPWRACALALAVAGCTGVVSGPKGQSSPTGTPTGAGTGLGTGVAGSAGGIVTTGTAGTGAPTACNAAAPDPGDAPLTRLTQQQYLNTINDLRSE